MSDWFPMYLSFGIIFSLGIVLPLVLFPFTSNTINQNSILSPLIDFIDNGVDIEVPLIVTTKHVKFNPYDIFGQTIKNSIVSYLSVFSFIPIIIVLPLVVIVFFGYIYTIVKLLPTT